MDEFEKRKQDLINNLDNMLRNEDWSEPDELGWRVLQIAEGGDLESGTFNKVINYDTRHELQF